MSKQKLALITGATKGIGRSTSIAFSKAGWDLILLARNQNMLEDLKKELSAKSNKVYLVNCDLSQSDVINSSLKNVIEESGCPSVLINNAGFAYNGDLIGMPLETWQKIIQVNLTSIFQICSFTIPFMRKEGGLIINVSSHAANNAFPQWSAYCVSKAALASFTKCLREEERANFIRACTITLGSVNTPLWDSEFVNSDFNRDSMLSAKKVSEIILFMAEQPDSQIIEDLTLMPSTGAF
tara:strand:+ start:1122 stop:1838 length:717 start_codon:yes stop_codon:yes gene_type:complete